MDKTVDSLIQFPCLYPLKVMGNNSEEFCAAVNSIVEKHLLQGEEAVYQRRPSSGNRYVSITVTIPLQNLEQLTTICEELNKHDLVLMTL